MNFRFLSLFDQYANYSMNDSLERIVDSLISLHRAAESIPYSYKEPGLTKTDYMGIFFGILVLVFLFCLFFVILPYLLNDRKSKLTGDTLNENWAHIHLIFAASLLRRDRIQLFEKSRFIRMYMLENFPEESDDLNFHLMDYLRNPTDIKLVEIWLSEFLPPLEERIKLLHFLYALCLEDGDLVSAEYAELTRTGNLLQIPQEQLEEILSVFFRKQEKQRTQEKKVVPTIHKREKALAILELDSTYNAEKLKKQYRKLVKLYHPDRFINESELALKNARLKFIEIQEAYEYLSLQVK